MKENLEYINLVKEAELRDSSKTDKTISNEKFSNPIFFYDRVMGLIDTYKSYVNVINDDEKMLAGDQWTKEEESNLAENNGQNAISINELLPMTEEVLSEILGEPIQFDVVGKSDRQDDEKQNELFYVKSVFDAIRHYNDFPIVLLESLRKFVGIGSCTIHVDHNHYDELGNTMIKLEEIHPRDRMVDPTSKKQDYSDARYIVLRKRDTLERLKILYPDKSFELAINNKNSDKTDNALLNFENASLNADVDREAEVYYNYDCSYRKAYKVNSELMKLLYSDGYSENNSFITEDALNEFNKKGVLDEDVLNLIKQSKVFVKKIILLTITHKTTILHQEVIDIPMFPVVSAYHYSFDGQFPFGLVRIGKDIQDLINKINMLIIDNTIMINDGVWVYDKSRIAENDLKSILQTKGPKIIEYMSNPNNTTEPAHYIAMPQIDINALMGVLKIQQGSLQSATGVYNLQQGDPQSAPETYAATMALKQFSKGKIGLKYIVIESFMTKLSKVVLYLAKEYMDSKTTLPYLGDDKKLQTIAMNSEHALKDISLYEIVCTIGKGVPTNRLLKKQFYSDLFKEGVIDDIAYINSLDIPDKNDIIERRSQLSQAVQQLEQLSNELKTCKEESDRYKQMYMTANTKLSQEKDISDLNTRLNNIETDLKIQKANELNKFKLKLEKEKNDTNLPAEK